MDDKIADEHLITLKIMKIEAASWELIAAYMQYTDFQVELLGWDLPAPHGSSQFQVRRGSLPHAQTRRLADLPLDSGCNGNCHMIKSENF